MTGQSWEKIFCRHIASRKPLRSVLFTANDHGRQALVETSHYGLCGNKRHWSLNIVADFD